MTGTTKGIANIVLVDRSLLGGFDVKCECGARRHVATIAAAIELRDTWCTTPCSGVVRHRAAAPRA